MAFFYLMEVDKDSPFDKFVAIIIAENKEEAIVKAMDYQEKVFPGIEVKRLTKKGECDFVLIDRKCSWAEFYYVQEDVCVIE